MQATKPIKDPRKQRKLLYNAPAHVRHRLMAAPVSPQLTASKNAKSLPVRKGDTVRIMRGDNKGFEGKISRVDLKNYKIYVEGLTREKVDGTTIFVPVHPSKVMIKNLNLSDKWRKAILERKEKLPEKEVKAEKPVEKSREIAERAAKKPAAKAAKVEEVKETAEEKPAKVVEEVVEKAVVEEKLEKQKPKAKPTAARAKARKKAAPKKSKKEEPVEEKPTEKEKKPRAVKAARKTRAKRGITSEKEGGK